MRGGLVGRLREKGDLANNQDFGAYASPRPQQCRPAHAHKELHREIGSIGSGERLVSVGATLLETPDSEMLPFLQDEIHSRSPRDEDDRL